MPYLFFTANHVCLRGVWGCVRYERVGVWARGRVADVVLGLIFDFFHSLRRHRFRGEDGAEDHRGRF